MNDFFMILILSTIGSLAGMIGGVIFLFKKEWAKKLSKYAVPFAAGVLLAVSILHLLPEAEHGLGDTAFIVVLTSFIGSFLFEQYFASLHHHEEKEGTLRRASVPLIVVGDTIHNFIDGVTIAAAFMTNPGFGFVVTLATFLHETPHEIGDFGVLISSGWTRMKTFKVNFLSALATFPGAFITYFFLQDAQKQVSLLLAISGGIFLFLGASDFLPEVAERETKGKWKEIVFVILGVSVMYFLSLVVPEH